MGVALSARALSDCTVSRSTAERMGRVAIVDLERQIRRGLLGLLKVFRRNNITIRGFLRMYDQFTTRSGYVTVKDAVAPTPTSTPAPESFAEMIARSDARTAMLKEARIRASKDRLKGLSSVYKG